MKAIPMPRNEKYSNILKKIFPAFKIPAAEFLHPFFENNFDTRSQNWETRIKNLAAALVLFGL
jgi:hypothetical protein